MIVVYVWTLRLDDDTALARADEKIDALATELDPKTAKVTRSVSHTKKPEYRKAGALHGGEPPLIVE